MASNLHPPTEGELRETESFRMCVSNLDYPVSLEVGRLYRQLLDESLEPGEVRIVDESGESYIYPGKRFGSKTYEVSTSSMHAEMDRLREELTECRGLLLAKDTGLSVADDLLRYLCGYSHGLNTREEFDAIKPHKVLEAVQDAMNDRKPVVQASGSSEGWFGGSDPTDSERSAE